MAVRPPAGARGPVHGPRPHGPSPEITQNRAGFRQVTSGKFHVRKTQQFLNDVGYHVSVDGVLGPQTRAAIADWHTGPKHRPMLQKHKDATKTVLDGRNPPKPKSTPAPKGGGGGGGGRGKTASAPAPAPVADQQIIDPVAYARAAAQEAYGPVIADLLNQQTQTKAQGTQNQADITSWFGQLEGTRKRSAGADAAALAKAVQTNQQDVAGIEGLFGQSGGHDLAGVAANNLANIRATGQSTSDFNSHMAAVLQAQGVDAHLASQRGTAASLADIAAKLTAQKSAKGSAYQKALQDAYGTRLQQQAAIQNMDLARQMAPVQLATARAGLASTKARTTIALRQMELQGKQAALQDKITRAQLAQFKQTSSGATVPFKTLQAGDRLKLNAAITKGIRSNVLGTHRTKSAEGNHKVWGAIKAMLSPYDVKDPAVRQFALGILRQLSGHFDAKHFK